MNQRSAKLSVDTLQDATHSLRDASDRAREVVDTLGDKATEFYDDAGKWIRANPGKIMGGAAIVAGVSVIGYLVYRGITGSKIEDTESHLRQSA